ncbi:hypothetical protein QYF36_027303 [Acer negundo]|nr:hypothetical protein QYF36_027303 [Acer negundo]
MTKTAAKRPKATDPPTENLLKLAPFVNAVGTGAPAGCREIVDGGLLGESGVDGSGGEFTEESGDGAEGFGVGVDGGGGVLVGDGAAADVGGFETGAETGGVINGGDRVGEGDGEDVGDCAVAETTRNSMKVKRAMVEFAIFGYGDTYDDV